MHQVFQRSLSLAVLGLLLSSAGLFAEPLPTTLSERIDVVEIQLEVLVTDRDGRPIDDLAAEDFLVEISGETATVLAADLVGGTGGEAMGQERRDPRSETASRSGSAPAATSPRANFDDSLTLVLFVDEQNLSPLTSGRMLGQIYLFLDSELRPGDRVMVVSYDRGVQIRSALTDDLDDVRQTLVDLVNEQAGRMTMDPEQQTLRTLKQMYDSGIPCTFLEPVATSYADEEYGRTLRTIAGLQRFVESLAGLPGRKAILHVSNGLPLVGGMGALEFLIDVCTPAGLARGVERNPNVSSRVDGGLSMQVDSAKFDTSNQWRELAARANRNNVTFYPLQAIGLRDPSFAGADEETRTLSPAAGINTRWNRQDALVMLAVETGGAAILNQNRVSEALGRMQNDLRHYYRLSVRLDSGEAGKVNTVKVDVDRPRAKVRHRKSLRFQSRNERVAAAVLAAAIHGTGVNTMGLTAEMQGSTKIDKNLRTVRVKLNIPIASLTLLPAGPETDPEAVSKGQFTVYVAATDAEGGTTPVRRSTMTVERTRNTADESKNYVFELEMEMKKGEHMVGFGVLDEVGGGSSFLRTVVEG